MSSKERLDKLLIDRGIALDIREAKGLILAGSVYSKTTRLDKAGHLFHDDIPLEIKTKRNHPWVSRGGIKLAHGLKYFAIDAMGSIALDVGASTGGFTDVLLTEGAEKVYAVDVGHGELAWKLQTDSRVVVLDKTNAKYLTEKIIPEKVDIIVCDASFIGLKTVLAKALSFAKNGTKLIALIKPQFEAEKHQVGNGIITDPQVHTEVCLKIEQWLGEQNGWSVLGITESPIKGKEGNKEFLIGGIFL